MKVLHLVKTSTGAVWALRLMRELVTLGVEIHVALPPNGALEEQYRLNGIRVHHAQFDFPIKTPWHFSRIFRQLQQVVADIKPDLIHSHFVGTTLTMRLALGRQHPIPRIFQVPGPLHLENPIMRHIEIATAGKLDYWIGTCQWSTNRYLASNISKKRVFLSYYGTDISRFTNIARGKLRRELGLDSTATLVGMVAFMYPPKRYLGQKYGLKGHEDFIDAIYLLLQKAPNVYGIIIGGPWNNAIEYERYLKTYAKVKCGNRIVFLGTRHDVPELYSDLDVVVHPSHSENVGGACESLLMRVPTIATNVGGFPDLIINGQTGLLVQPHSPDAICTAVLQILNNPNSATAMTISGFERVQSMFDIYKTSQQIGAIYQQILT